MTSAAMESQPGRRLGSVDVAVFAACGVLGMIVLGLHHDLRHDDAYITFKYARSIAEGDGFVFNEGERVLGTTTPLFTLIMALVYAAFGDIVAEVAIAISALALAVQGGLLWALLHRRSPWTALAVALATVVGLGGIWSNLALETSLYAALVIGTIVALSRRSEVLAGVCLGMAFLTRYDAGLLILVVVGWIWIERRTLPMRALLVSLAVVLPWLVFAQVYFGSPLPHTLGAKTSITPMLNYLDHYRDLALGPLFGLGGVWFGSTLAVGFAMLGLRWMWREARPLLVLVAYAVAHTVAYAWIGPMALQHWHMYVPVLVARLVIVLGVIGTIEQAARARRRGTSPVLLGAVALACALIVATTVADMRRHAMTYRYAFWLGGRHSKYERVAAWIDIHVAPRSSMMATEVGTIGYLTRRRMIDPFGLITETNDWPRTKRLRAKLDLIRLHSPDVVLFDSVQEAAAAERDLGYRVVHVFPWRWPWSVVAARDARTLTGFGQPLWYLPAATTSDAVRRSRPHE